MAYKGEFSNEEIERILAERRKAKNRSRRGLFRRFAGIFGALGLSLGVAQSVSDYETINDEERNVKAETMDEKSTIAVEQTQEEIQQEVDDIANQIINGTYEGSSLESEEKSLEGNEYVEKIEESLEGKEYTEESEKSTEELIEEIKAEELSSENLKDTLEQSEESSVENKVEITERNSTEDVVQTSTESAAVPVQPSNAPTQEVSQPSTTASTSIPQSTEQQNIPQQTQEVVVESVIVPVTLNGLEVEWISGRYMDVNGYPLNEDVLVTAYLSNGTELYNPAGWTWVEPVNVNTPDGKPGSAEFSVMYTYEDEETGTKTTLQALGMALVTGKEKGREEVSINNENWMDGVITGNASQDGVIEEEIQQVENEDKANEEVGSSSLKVEVDESSNDEIKVTQPAEQPSNEVKVEVQNQNDNPNVEVGEVPSKDVINETLQEEYVKFDFEIEDNESETEPDTVIAETSEPETEPVTVIAETSEPETEPATVIAETSEPETEPATVAPETSEPETEPATVIPETSEPETEPATVIAETSEPETEPATVIPETSEQEVTIVDLKVDWITDRHMSVNGYPENTDVRVTAYLSDGTKLENPAGWIWVEPVDVNTADEASGNAKFSVSYTYNGKTEYATGYAKVTGNEGRQEVDVQNDANWTAESSGRIASGGAVAEERIDENNEYSKNEEINRKADEIKIVDDTQNDVVESKSDIDETSAGIGVVPTNEKVEETIVEEQLVFEADFGSDFGELSDLVTSYEEMVSEYGELTDYIEETQEPNNNEQTR